MALAFSVLIKIGRDEFVSMENNCKTCTALNRNIEEIMPIIIGVAYDYSF